MNTVPKMPEEFKGKNHKEWWLYEDRTESVDGCGNRMGEKTH